MLAVSACAPQQQAASNAAQQEVKTKTQQDDSGKWDLTVFDPGFDTFLSIHAYPKSMYSLSFLKAKNQALVTEWNNDFYAGRHRNVIESSVDYDPNTDYGIDFEYKLFEVFVYTSWRYRVRFYNLGPVSAYVH